jgi:hypothetical protein
MEACQLERDQNLKVLHDVPSLEGDGVKHILFQQQLIGESRMLLRPADMLKLTIEKLVGEVREDDATTETVDTERSES